MSSILRNWFEIAPSLPDVAATAYSGEYGAPGSVCPPASLVFRALESLSPESVRVVVLGQDPYHVPGKASGLAFGYHQAYTGRIDSSLYNILVETGIPQEKWRDIQSLEHLPEQGVLLLNTRLTVLADSPLSHAYPDGPGWEKPVTQILEAINNLHGRHCVWLLFGAEARRQAELAGVLTPRHLHGATVPPNVLITSHPCRFSNTAKPNPFTGSQVFTRANEYLISQGLPIINWGGTVE